MEFSQEFSPQIDCQSVCYLTLTYQREFLHRVIPISNILAGGRNSKRLWLFSMIVMIANLDKMKSIKIITFSAPLVLRRSSRGLVRIVRVIAVITYDENT